MICPATFYSVALLQPAYCYLIPANTIYLPARGSILGFSPGGSDTITDDAMTGEAEALKLRSVSPPFMPTFNNLPLELLPVIVQNIVNPESLALFCLVSKAFCDFTRPFLYNTITVFPWNQKEKVMERDHDPLCKELEYDLLAPLLKIIKLFRTLSSCPELAQHVRRLGDVFSVRWVCDVD